MTRRRPDLVLQGIYDAALSPAQWPVVLAAVADLLGAHAGFFFSTHSDAHPDLVLHEHGVGPGMIQEFVGGWYAHDPWMHAARQSGQTSRNTVVTSEDLLSRELFLRSDYYHAFTRRYDIAGMVGSVLFDGSESDLMPFTNLCWYRPEQAAPFGPAEKRHLRFLLPHFQRAMRIQRRLGWMADERAHGLLGALRVASLLLDRAGQVHHANASGRTLLAQLPAGAYRHGQLRGLGLHCFPALADALAACRADHPIRLSVLHAGPLPVAASATLVVLPPERHTPLGALDDERLLLLAELPRADPEEAAAAAAGLFRLSRAETRVLAGLLAGESPVEIAARTGVSVATIRTQLAQLFTKTGTRAQNELLLLVSGIRG